MSIIADNIRQVRARVEQACIDAARPVESVTLVAVSKRFEASSVREAYEAGLRCFGENQVQEAAEKVGALGDLRGDTEWHLIGPLQSNKTRLAAETFDWVHSIDRLKVAQRLAEQRPRHLPPLQVCLQVNISGEASKGGFEPAELVDAVGRIAELPGMRVRGLMSMAAFTDDEAAVRRSFATTRGLLDEVARQVPALAGRELSMGMSNDFEIAVEEGSTLVRVGSVLFGERG